MEADRTAKAVSRRTGTLIGWTSLAGAGEAATLLGFAVSFVIAASRLLFPIIGLTLLKQSEPPAAAGQPPAEEEPGPMMAM